MGSIPELCVETTASDRVLCGLRNSTILILGATFVNSQLVQWLRPRLGLEPLPMPWSILEGWLLCWVPALLLAPFCLLRRSA